MTLAIVDINPNAVVPLHSHYHEQVGYVVEGQVEFTIGGDTRSLSAGDVYTIAGDVVHGAKAGAQSVKIIEVFHPVREEYR